MIKNSPVSRKADESLPPHYRLIAAMVRQADRDIKGLSECSQSEKLEARSFLKHLRGDEDER